MIRDLEILNNAPEGATHVQFDRYYWKVDSSQYFEWYKSCKKWVEVTDEDDIDLFDGFRALSDIKRIAELEDFVRDYASETCACRYPTICSKCKEIAYAKEILKGCE